MRAAATTVIAALVAPAFALAQSRTDIPAKPAYRQARSTHIARSARADCAGARSACRDAALWTAYACRSDCGRLADGAAVDSCRADCRTRRAASIALCRAVAEPCAAACAATDVACSAATRTCRAGARDAHLACRTGCADDFRCRIACDRQRAAAVAACAFVAAAVEPGRGDLPDLPSGRPANLAMLLDDAELAVVADADARAATLRSRPLRLWIGRADTDVTVTQVRHAFSFGFPIDFRDYRDAPEDLAFYTGIAVDHTNLMVAETSMKWRLSEPEEGRFTFDLADEELAWAESLGFPVKSHTLLWGNVPPFSSGTGVPVWVREMFANADPPAAEQELLRTFIRRQVETTVQRYRGRVQIWDVTNETLNIFTPFFIDRLGPGIVNDIFGWVNAIDPGAQLVFNEWITEVFTGLPGPSAADVRDRVRELLAAGVPIHAIGQQGHFVPGVVYAGGNADLSQRTRVDDYAHALDTLAEVGLPIHITETNFVAPDEPEARAAQAEAIMRVWWGHPAVEQIVFWGLWNKINARNYLHHGLWDDDGTLTRHGEAVVALLNERWRTRAVLRSDTAGAVELRATLGDYVASWEENGTPVHVRFRLDRGPGTATVAATRKAN